MAEFLFLATIFYSYAKKTVSCGKKKKLVLSLHHENFL